MRLFQVCLDLDRPQKAGGAEFPPVFDLDIGQSVAVFLLLAAITDKTVLPGVCHGDF